MSTDQHSTFPSWFARPHPMTGRQCSLFKSSFADTIVRLQISSDQIARWYERRWLSFDSPAITEVDEFDDPHVWELIVVRDVVRSGLDDAQVDFLLSQLPKPCAVDPDRLAFSFRHGWVQAVGPQDPEAIIEEHLDSWLEDCEEERLREIHERIDELLASSDNTSTENAE